MPEPQVIFSHSAHPDAAHDLAQPTSVAIPCHNISGEAVYLLKSVGGLTKLEQVAATVSGTLVGAIYAGKPDAEDIAEIASVSVDIAEALLAECAKRQAPKEQPSAIEVAG